MGLVRWIFKPTSNLCHRSLVYKNFFTWNIAADSWQNSVRTPRSSIWIYLKWFSKYMINLPSGICRSSFKSSLPHLNKNLHCSHIGNGVLILRCTNISHPSQRNIAIASDATIFLLTHAINYNWIEWNLRNPRKRTSPSKCVSFTQRSLIMAWIKKNRMK